MRKWLASHIASLAICLFVSSCQIAGHDTSVSGTSRIRTGYSFGFCIGYCWAELTIDEHERTFVYNSGLRNDPDVPERKLKKETQPDTWQRLLSLVNFDEIAAMDNIYGCPDCADGGSEWIEVSHGGNIKKVIFEYGTPLEPISTLLDSLRSIREEMLHNLIDK